MILSDRDIKKAVKAGDIEIKDFNEERLNPASYDILLGNKFIMTSGHSTSYIDPVKEIFAVNQEIVLKDDEPYILHPGVSILGTSWDFFGSDKYLIQLSGKSSLARIGLLVHNTAGLINPGHHLNITLELCNLNKVPIILRPKMRIGQLIFSQMTSAPDKDYKKVGRYHNNDWNSYIVPKVLKKETKAKKENKK